MGKLNEARTGYKGDGWKTWHSSARLSRRRQTGKRGRNAGGMSVARLGS